MSIPTDRLREIADGAMGIGAPLVLTQAEQVAVCTELLALRDATSLPGYTRLVEERDASRATLDDVCKALGADVDSAVAQALMFKEKAGELAAVKRQRDELLASAQACVDAAAPLSYCGEDGDRAVEHYTATGELAYVVERIAAEQPKPQDPEVQP